MNIRIVTLLIALLSLPALAYAGGKGVPAAAASERAALMQTLERGLSITSNKQEYQVLPGVRAAKKHAQEQPQQTIARMGGSQLVETKGLFVLYTAAPQTATSVKTVNGTSYPAVVNTRTDVIGIMPGTLIVKLKGSNGAAAIAKEHGLEVVRVFAHLNTAFYRVKSGQDVASAAVSVAADARVESAEVEIIEHVKVAN